VTDLYHSAGPKAGVNAGLVFTRNSVVFIDSGMTIASAEYLWKLAEDRISRDTKIFLILTHHHADHTFGMRIFKDKGARVIAHPGVNEFLANDGGYYIRFIRKSAGWDEKTADEILGDVRLSAPDQTIDKDDVLKIDGEEIHILATPGHVFTELFVYHPESRTLFAGDAIYEGSDPTTRFGGPEDWKEWIAQLRRLQKLNIRTIVPGHGKLCGLGEIERNIAFLEKKIGEASPPTSL
jgi:cyclase